jgi:hypothetical protein
MKQNSKLITYVAYGLAVLGFMLAFAQAIVPQLGMTGHRLAFGVFAWAAVPYIAYVFVSGIVRGLALLVPGIVLVAIDFVVTWSERFAAHAPPSSPVLDSAPAWLTLVVLPLGVLAGRQLSQALRDDGGDDGEPPHQH